MTIADDLIPVLTLPDPVAAALTHVRVAIGYTPRAVAEGLPAELRGTLGDTTKDLNHLLKAGFLGDAGTSAFTIASPAPDRVEIDWRGTPVHPDLIVLLLRLVYATHQTPPGSWEMLLAALDGDEAAAREVYAGIDFAPNVAFVAVTAEGEGATPFDPLRPAGDTAGLPDYIDGTLTAPGVPEPRGKIEEGWLSLWNLGAFLPPGAGEAGAEPEFFARDGGLTISGLRAEGRWVAALLAILAPGQRVAAQVTD